MDSDAATEALCADSLATCEVAIDVLVTWLTASEVATDALCADSLFATEVL